MADTWRNNAVRVSSEGQSAGNVVVKTLNFVVTREQDGYTAEVAGTTPDTGKRVYTIPALEVVPDHVRTGWIQEVLGAGKLAEIDAELDAQIQRQIAPVETTVSFE